MKELKEINTCENPRKLHKEVICGPLPYRQAASIFSKQRKCEGKGEQEDTPGRKSQGKTKCLNH